jgi:hypothetical protein
LLGWAGVDEAAQGQVFPEDAAMFKWALRSKPKQAVRVEGTARDRVGSRLDGGARERVASQTAARREPRAYAARPTDLLQVCIAHAVRGDDFYDVYDNVLRPSALVDNGIAVMMADCGAAVRKVPLRRGGAFVFSEETKQWSLDRRPFLR